MTFKNFTLAFGVIFCFTTILTARSIGFNPNTSIGWLSTSQRVEFCCLTDSTCSLVGISSDLGDGVVVIDTVRDLKGRKLAVVSIDSFALSDCAHLRNLTLGPSVRHLCPLGVSVCPELEQVRIEGAIDTLPYAAFAGCRSLRRVTLSNGVRHIDDLCFADCPMLEHIVLPASVLEIGAMVFTGDTAATIVITNPFMKWNVGSFKGVRRVTIVDTDEEVPTDKADGDSADERVHVVF